MDQGEAGGVARHPHEVEALEDLVRAIGAGLAPVGQGDKLGQVAVVDDCCADATVPPVKRLAQLDGGRGGTGIRYQAHRWDGGPGCTAGAGALRIGGGRGAQGPFFGLLHARHCRRRH